MNLKNYAPYILSTLFIVWIAFLLYSDENIGQIILSVDIFEFSLSLLISLLMFLISGYQLKYLIKKNSGKTLELKDLVLLPASMNLWSYLLPFRGGLIYSAFYIKLKYNVELTKGFSIGIYTFVLSTSLAGLFGLYLSIDEGNLGSWFGILSLILFLSPGLLLWTKGILNSINIKTKSIWSRLFDFINKTLRGYGVLFVDVMTTFLITILILFSIFIYIIWVYWASESFGFGMSITSIIILALVLRLSVIARFIPGNIGIQELISGATTTMMGGNIQEGILIALFIRVTALLIAVVLGTYSFLNNIDIFKTDSLFDLWKKFKIS